jgi:transcriptional regulator with XRE-family HTH domain
MKYETFAKRLGRQLAELRQEKGITQAKLSYDADLSLKYVSMIEQGTNPSLRTIFKVCGALDVPLEEVMERAGIGTVPGKKTKKMEAVQVDLPEEDPLVKRLINFIRRLDKQDRQTALRLIKTTFGD